MLKKISINAVLLAIFSFFIYGVYMDSVFAQVSESGSNYTNQNGVVISEKEYQFINDFYGSEYFNTMTLEDYEWIRDLNIDENEVEIKTNPNITLFSTSVTQYGINIKIVKSCSNNCIIITNCQWSLMPSIKSYDVIGARFSNTNLVDNTITTKITSSSGTVYSTDLLRLTNGFGVTVKLPSNGVSIVVEQKYTVSKGGTVYASYQHATKNINLATSKLYTITSNGYGGVFGFYGSAANVYDRMTGVNIDL